MSRDEVLDAVESDRVVAVIRGRQVADAAGLADALVTAGIRCVEFTFTIPSALEAIRCAAASGAAIVGAGTVLEARQAEQAIEAGARFIVSPAVTPAITEPCRGADVPVFMGALTPTEIVSAIASGAAAVKLFPASFGGPAYLRELRGPFPDVVFVPSGGVDPAKARRFIDAGAIAVYAGSSLAPPELVASGEYTEITNRALAFVAAVR